MFKLQYFHDTNIPAQMILNDDTNAQDITLRQYYIVLTNYSQIRVGPDLTSVKSSFG